ncbi:hypothetical protein PGT21_003570 [Puccinia graminis f. sp. tritici]|uniref:Uncharacterized protein n=1 Tax=Puccinia graminis f. sp. tritici TaxID=56615 RepID=A0A5B0PQD2_PUCGR|nr:hypothetical protein PGT21_003570 [Puccinia graminis f. sp. tritici]
MHLEKANQYVRQKDPTESAIEQTHTSLKGKSIMNENSNPSNQLNLTPFQEKALFEIENGYQGDSLPQSLDRYCDLTRRTLNNRQKDLFWKIIFEDEQVNPNKTEIRQKFNDLISDSPDNPNLPQEVLEVIQYVDLQFKRWGLRSKERKIDLNYLTKADH